LVKRGKTLFISCIKIYKMQETVLLSLPLSQLQTLIIDAVNACLDVRQTSHHPQPDPDRWLDLTALCNYHPDQPSKQTVYQWVNSGLIPVHKGGKKLRFLKSEIDTWLKQGKKLTNSDIEAKTDGYLSTKKPRY